MGRSDWCLVLGGMVLVCRLGGTGWEEAVGNLVCDHESAVVGTG